MKWKVFTGTSACLQASVATGKTYIIHSIDQCNTESRTADQALLQRCLHGAPVLPPYEKAAAVSPPSL